MKTVTVEYKQPRQAGQRAALRTRRIKALEMRANDTDSVARDLLYRHPLVEDAIAIALGKVKRLGPDPDRESPEFKKWWAIFKWLMRHKQAATRNPTGLARPNLTKWGGGV